MKKSFLVIGGILAIALAGVALAQTQRNASLRSTIASLQREISVLKAEREADRRSMAELKTRNEVYQSESDTLRKTLTAAPQTSGGPDAPGESKEGGAAGEKSGFMRGFAKMFNDPESRKAMRGQQAMGVRMMYGDVAKELGLTPEEANQLVELLIERQMTVAGKSMELMADAKDPAKLEAAGKQIAEDRKQHDEQIKGLLGDERMKKLTEYEKTIGDRMQMQQYQQSFTAAGVPLQDAQRDQLLNIMKEERVRMPESPFDSASKDVTAQVKAMQSGEGIDQALKHMQKFNEAVLPRARAVLTPEQSNTFEAAQKQQIEMMQFGMKMSREMFGRGDGGSEK